MEVLSKVTDEGRKRCRELLDADICKVELLDTPVVLHIVIEMCAGEDTVCLEIKYDHINVTRIEKNGEILLDADQALEEKEAADRSLLNLEDIREFADTVELSDVKNLLDTQIKSNMAIAHEGMTGKYGLGIGRVIREIIPMICLPECEALPLRLPRRVWADVTCRLSLTPEAEIRESPVPSL